MTFWNCGGGGDVWLGTPGEVIPPPDTAGGEARGLELGDKDGWGEEVEVAELSIARSRLDWSDMVVMRTGGGVARRGEARWCVGVVWCDAVLRGCEDEKLS